MQASSKSIFITGATGFIGQRLVSDLMRQGFRVRAMVRPNKLTDNRLPPGCKQVPVGLTDVDALIAELDQASAVIYCAGTVRGRNARDFATANINGINSLVAAMSQSETRPPVLLLSSLAATRPNLSAYAESKFKGEQILRKQAWIPWTILRPPAVYGPGDQEMLPILKMVRRGMIAHAGPVDQRLSLIHVDDLVRAIIAWLSATENCLHDTFEIDDGRPGGYSWPAIGKAVSERRVRVMRIPDFILSGAAQINMLTSKLFRYSPMFSPGKVRELIQSEWLCENKKFTEATGWKPQVDLHLGVQRLFLE